MIVYFVPGLMTALILTLIVIVFILKVNGSRRNNEAAASQRHGQNDSNADPGIFFVRRSYFHLTLIQTSLHGNELALISNIYAVVQDLAKMLLMLETELWLDQKPTIMTY